MLSLGLSINRTFPVMGAGSGGGPTTAPEVSAARAEGFTATYSSPGTFDPAGSPEYVVALSPGFDASGNATTVTSNIVIMDRLRQVHPNQASETTDGVTLSDFIYSNDTIVGVTNSSTLTAPVPQAMWLTKPDQHCLTTSYTVKLAVSHAYARNGRPVAAVVFTATDESSNSVSVTVTSMTTKSYMASGLTVPHFEATFDLTTLTQGEVVEVTAEIRPWRGAAFTIGTDTDSYPSCNLCPLRFLNDKTGAYGQYFAYVDSATGNDTTGVVSQTASLAQAAPYATINAAAIAIETSTGRSNVSGGVIRIEDGTHPFTSFFDRDVDAVPMVVEAANAANKATTILNGPSGGSDTFICPRTEFRKLTLRQNHGSGGFFLRGGAASKNYSNCLIMDDCIYDENGFTWNSAVYLTGRQYFEECSLDNAGGWLSRTTTNLNDCANIVGCDITLGGCASYGIAGTKVANGLSEFSRGSTQRDASDGGFAGFNHFGRSGGTGQCFIVQTTVGARGMGFVGNVFESYGGNSGATLYLNADGNSSPAQNVVIQANTFRGERNNLFYNESADVVKYGFVSHNIFDRMNLKSDVFGSGSYDGNWAGRYRAAWLGNTIVLGTNNTTAPAPGSWFGEIDYGLGEVSFYENSSTAIVVDFVNDESNEGDNAGGGDYTPGALYAGSVIASGNAPYSHDQKGRAIPNDGTGVAGAIQKAA